MEFARIWATIGVDDGEFKSGLSSAGRNLAKTGAAMAGAFVAIGTGAITVGEKFRQSGNIIRAQTGQSQEDVENVKRGVRDLALETGRFRADEMLSALGDISRRGQDADWQMRMLRQGQRLAQTGTTDFGTSLRNLDALMVKFNTDVEDASKWVNTLAVAKQEMGIHQDAMVDGLQRSAGIAQAASLSYDFLAASLSIAKQGGMSMQTASSGLVGVFNQMLDPLSNVRQGMDQLGTEIVKNVDGTTNAQQSFENFIRELYAADPVVRETIMTTMGLSGSQLDLFNNLKMNQDELQELSAMFGYAQEAGDDYRRVTQMGADATGGLTEAFGLARNFGQEFLLMINDIIGSRFYDWVRNITERVRDFLSTEEGMAKVERVATAVGEAFYSIVSAAFELGMAIAPLIASMLPVLAGLLQSLANFFNNNEWAVRGLITAIVLLKANKVLGGLPFLIAKVAGKKGLGLLKTAFDTLAVKIIPNTALTLGGLSSKTMPAVGKGAMAMAGKKGGAGILGAGKKILLAMGPKGWVTLGVIAGGMYIANNWENMKESARNSWENITGVIRGELNLHEIETQTIMGRIVQIVDGQWLMLADNLITVWNRITGENRRTWSQMREDGESGGRRMIRGAIDGIQSLSETLRTRVANLAIGVRNRFNSELHQNHFFNIAGNVITGFVNGITNGKSRAFNSVVNWGQGILARFRETLGISSPSRVFAYFGQMSAEGYNGGLAAGFGDIIKQVDRYTDQIVDKLKETTKETYTFRLSPQMTDISSPTAQTAFSQRRNLSQDNQNISITINVDGYTDTDLIDRLGREVSRQIRLAGA